MGDNIVSCLECNRLFKREKITKSGLCENCVKELIKVFSLTPAKVIYKVHELQKKENNTPCFNTGEKDSCGQDSCEWQDICDLKVAENAV